MTSTLHYQEELSSNKTELLFILLTIGFTALFLRQVEAGHFDWLTAVLFIFAVFFFFYAANYRTLRIQLTTSELSLSFGLFTWRVPLANIADCRLDSLPPLLQYGGAGIHFMTFNHRYRASFNFLEYPRIVIAFRTKQDLVQDLSFSTRHPDELLRLLREAVSVSQTTLPT